MTREELIDKACGEILARAVRAGLRGVKKITPAHLREAFDGALAGLCWSTGTVLSERERLDMILRSLACMRVS